MTTTTASPFTFKYSRARRVPTLLLLQYAGLPLVLEGGPSLRGEIREDFLEVDTVSHRAQGCGFAFNPCAGEPYARWGTEPLARCA